MTRAEQLLERIDGATVSNSDGGEWARPVLDLPADQWRVAVAAARDGGFDFFDWLSAVDEGDEGFRIVAHLWSLSSREGVLLRALLDSETPVVASIVDIYPGAAWHERETFEMFGIDFENHPDLRKLLLADEFDAHPLRKSFVLAARALKAWPGAVEPGEKTPPGAVEPGEKVPPGEKAGSEGATPAGRRPAASRRRLLPPGVPEPGTWGPV